MKKHILLIISLLLASINFNLLLKPLNLVTGGTQGFAIILKHILSIKPSLSIFIINILALVISLFFLKKETTLSIILSTFIYPLFIKLTSPIPEVNFLIKVPILSSILAGIICGITNGVIFKLNFSSGGITIISVLLKKYCHIKVSTSTFIINTLIILIGNFYFGFIKLLYSLVVVSISSTTIHLIMKKRMTIS